ncbi:EamA family transporter [Agromyces intestinalis]|uniref:EamA family transporter n=1 Tax=Agromyces intestinalis TaxID=2592652 RepID=A0A5C1YHG3_9MICO|nr:EamA family transporter [Agromyces intestinalis]QEO15048.1 EamA family transporter [Agromyces intestinalis]
MRYVAAVLLAALCFGTTGTAQALGPDADPISIGAARLVIGGGALGLIAAIQWFARRLDPPRRASEASVASPRRAIATWGLVLLGAAGVVAYQPAFFAGTAANGVAIGTVVALGSAPVITGALDWLTRRRYPGARWLAATAVATCGVALLAFADGGTGGGTSPLGLLASVGAGASYAVYTLAGKALIDRGWQSNASMGAMFGTAAVAGLPVLLLTDASWLATPAGLAMALWLGLVTTTIAYVLFGAGLVGLAPATVSTLTLAEPLTAGLLGVLLLGEQLAPRAWLGLAVLAAGIVVLAVPGSGRPRGDRARPAPPPMSEVAPTVDAWTSSSSPVSGSTPHRGGR